eukprot:scaffold5018_cov74-Phaeocystis_antarctica.AAC.1
MANQACNRGGRTLSERMGFAARDAGKKRPEPFQAAQHASTSHPVPYPARRRQRSPAAGPAGAQPHL